MILKAININKRQQIRDDANIETAKEVASFLKSAGHAGLVSSAPLEIVR